MAEDLFVARQPIYNEGLETVGYELLYRTGDTRTATIHDADQASSRLIVTTFMEMGLESLVGSQRAYINLSRPFVTAQIPLPMSPEQVALEIGPELALDRRLLPHLRRLAEDGYRLVLDDFEYRPAYEPALRLAGYVKLDALRLHGPALRANIARVRHHPLKIIAERVETRDAYRHCRDAGCDWFQGFFFCEPAVLRGRRLPAPQQALLGLLARLEDPESSAAQVETLLAQDATLAFRLLRYVNCASLGLRVEVESLRHAVVLVGLATIRQWTALILVARLGGHDARELLATAMVRARMSQLLAVRLSGVPAELRPEQAFTVGLLSVLDALLERPMEDILDGLPLGYPLMAALAAREGPLGALLSLVADYDSGAWDRLPADIDASELRRSYLEAVRWSEEQRRNLEGLDL